MKGRKLGGVALLFVGLTLACASNPRDLTLPSDVKALEDTEFVSKVKTLPEEDRELLSAYLVRRELGKAFGVEAQGLPVTVGEAIEQQKAFLEQKRAEEEEVARLAAKVKAEREAKATEMKQAVTVALTDFKFSPSDYRSRKYADTFDIALAIENKGQRDIEGLKGQVVFSDMFGEEIKRVGLSFDEGVKAGKTVQWRGSMDFNQFRDEDKRLRSIGSDKLKFRFDPLVLLFADGSKIEAPQ